jgi:hypothetical protein
LYLFRGLDNVFKANTGVPTDAFLPKYQTFKKYSQYSRKKGRLISEFNHRSHTRKSAYNPKKGFYYYDEMFSFSSVIIYSLNSFIKVVSKDYLPIRNMRQIIGYLDTFFFP